MKIADSTVAMEAQRHYQKVEVSTATHSLRVGGGEGGQIGFGRFDAVSLSEEAHSFERRNVGYQADDPLDSLDQALSERVQETSDPEIRMLHGIVRLLKSIQQHVNGNRYGGGTPANTFGDDPLARFTLAPGVWRREVMASHFVSETENTTFSTVGVARTEDGREIQFDLDLEMSRSFMEYSSLKYAEEVSFTDPLVINLGAGSASYSDREFLFDIDADGTQDKISQLDAQSGYLALDRNGDGQINDGSELFGARTGNGFDELGAYDQDHNGWIDENDEIFTQLRVWTKDADGNDKLAALAEMGVGAINLGSVATNFTLKSAQTGQTNAQVRRTGFYLREDGGSGTVQHVDVAV